MDAIALSIIYAQHSRLLNYQLIFHKLCDGLHTHDMTDLVNGLDHGTVNGVLSHIAHQHAIYVQKIDIEIL